MITAHPREAKEQLLGKILSSYKSTYESEFMARSSPELKDLAMAMFSSPDSLGLQNMAVCILCLDEVTGDEALSKFFVEIAKLALVL
jgi:hypothetical protein